MSTFNSLLTNNYFSYILCTIIKVILLYALYLVIKFIKRKFCKSKNCCQILTHCFKRPNKLDPQNVTIELTDDLPNEDICESSSLRRISRIAKLKEKP